jgi:hypothetical protein
MSDLPEVKAFPPTAETMTYGAERLPQRRMSPGVVGGLDGPAGPLGPEVAGGLTLAYGAFADSESAQRGYRGFTDMQAAMYAADGFVRWISFADGPHGYGLGFWRSSDHALAFVRGPEHRSAVEQQNREPFEYSQFAGVWTAHTIGRRTLRCPACAGRAIAPERNCDRCGRRLNDGFVGSGAG